MRPTYPVPETAEIQTYLSYEGWNEGPPGVAGSLWSHNGHVIAVPTIIDKDSARGIVERLAVIAERKPEFMSEDIRYYRTDVTNFRAVLEEESEESIALDAAAAVMKSARSLLRSAATTAMRPQGDLRGHYSKLSGELARSARMGHTKRGSFIIPVLVPLSEPEEPLSRPDVLVDFDSRVPEPYERRAMRTLAQSLKAVQELIVDPAREPSLENLHDAVRLGVSRELCRAVNEVLVNPSIGELETQFGWAGSVKTPTTIPTSISLPSEANDLIEKAAKKLREARIEPPRMFSGPIVALRHEEDDPYGYVTISTVRNGRSAEIVIHLPYTRYRTALLWHRQTRTILVEGEVGLLRGHLTIVQPARCHPVDDLYLKHEDANEV